MLEHQIEIKGRKAASTSTSAAIPSPLALKDKLPLDARYRLQVAEHQQTIKAILSGEDKRLLVITGPCSLHCADAALDYARRLKVLQAKVADHCFLVMRAYLEKPRTTVGWKGMLYAPDLSERCDLKTGTEVSRRLLLQLVELGLPLATEALNPLAFSYIDDLVSWVAIGARTTESQIHREMASGLSCSVGFKNGTHGRFDTAVHAMLAASQGHSFLAVDEAGQMAVRDTLGNDAVQMVLRGGNGEPNYGHTAVNGAAESMVNAGLKPALIVDCSHENSGKDHRRQAEVVASVQAQIQSGQPAIRGVMLESHLQAGRQNIGDELDYGVSVTDACIGWKETEALVMQLAENGAAPASC